MEAYSKRYFFAMAAGSLIGGAIGHKFDDSWQKSAKQSNLTGAENQKQSRLYAILTGVALGAALVHDKAESPNKHTQHITPEI